MGISKQTFFPHLVYISDHVVTTTLLIILVGTFAIAIPSFATANQHKYGYRGLFNRNLAILTSDSESPQNLKPEGI